MNNQERMRAIEQALNVLDPSFVEVTDDSARHRNHPGAKSGKGHFCLRIAAPKLTKNNRIQAHRLIYDALGSLLENEIHALTINVLDNIPSC